MCSDALEAGHGETILTGDMIDGIFGTNGFDDDLQTDGADGTGDTLDDGANFALLETTKGTGDWLNDQEQFACEICNDPATKYGDYCDFDGDGVSNIDDIDDDNDGILDVAETAVSCRSLAQSEVFGTFGTASVSRDLENPPGAPYSFAATNTNAAQYAVVSDDITWH